MIQRQIFLLLFRSGVFFLAVSILGCSKSSEDELIYRPPAGNSELSAHLLSASQGQTVYVPAYSHIYHQDGRAHPLTVTLSVRNTNRKSDIVIESVDYYDSQGKKLRSYLDKPLILNPMATTAFLVKRDDISGGVGASFIVVWRSEDTTTPPIIDTVMIDTSGQQGLSFARSGVVILQQPEN